MIEMNIKIIKPGEKLFLDVRRVIVEGQGDSPPTLQKICNAFRVRYGLAAVPRGRELLVASRKPIEPMVEQGDNWTVTAKDSGEGLCLKFSNTSDRELLADLFQRSFIEEIRRRKNLWNLDSLSIWYSPQPFQTEEDIQVFRRFEMSVIPIDSIGLGVSVDVGTAFFTNRTVADYFLNDDSRYNEERFNFLSQRQREQKGTLLYEIDNRYKKCYFVKFEHGVTCGSTGTIRIKSDTYSSLLEYYQQKYKDISVEANDPVAKVSFKGITQPQFVAANRLYLRVMNEVLPESLKNVDKIPPKNRRDLIEHFWYEISGNPFGHGKPPIERRFWSPGDNKIQQLNPPILEFAGGKKLYAPSGKSPGAYKKYYKKRLALLNEVGCWYVPPTIERVIYFAVPDKVSETMRETIAKGITEKLSTWTRKDISYKIEPYSTLEEAFEKFGNKKQSGVVVFTFEDEDPATYFNIAHNLRSWRVKRITYHELKKSYDKHFFIETNALDVLQQLDCVPWSIASPLSYEAQLIIDVGEDKRYFALSLLICREQNTKPAFWLKTIVQPKPDNKRETINKKVLEDAIVNLFTCVKGLRFDPLNSLLVLRDGRKCGQEIEGIRSAQMRLQELTLLAENVKLDIVDFHKTSLKRIRLWQKDKHSIDNALEGTALFLDDKTVVLSNTGVSTLHQGTAMPLMLVAKSGGVDMFAVAEYVFATAQLNWSSPKVAQKLPLPSKQADDELKNRAAQEIKSTR